jgi:hypothetical protein
MVLNEPVDSIVKSNLGLLFWLHLLVTLYVHRKWAATLYFGIMKHVPYPSILLFTGVTKPNSNSRKQ